MWICPLTELFAFTDQTQWVSTKVYGIISVIKKLDHHLFNNGPDSPVTYTNIYLANFTDYQRISWDLQ